MNPSSSQMPPTFLPVNNLMASFPPQPHPPGGNAAHPMNPMMMMMPQQQAGLQAPNLLMQGFPSQDGQQWMLPQFQTPVVAPPTFQVQLVPQQPPSSDGNRANGHHGEPQNNNHMPIDLDTLEEDTLVNTLKLAKARGQTPLAALNKLDKVYEHTALEWKDYFLANLERLIPRIYPSDEARSGPTRSASERLPPSVSAKSHPPKQTKPPHGVPSRSSSSNAIKPNHKNSASARRPSPPPASQRPLKGLSTTPTHGKKKVVVELSQRGSAPAAASSSAHRTRRGEPVPEHHALTPIPPWSGMRAPKPPQGDRREDASRFTDEDKVFFIHFLHWRLGRPGAIPAKQDLYEALGAQMPRHNADAWKRHWDEHPELPDKIYIEARKRAEEIQLTPAGPGEAGYALLADSSDEEDSEEQGDDGEDAVADNASVVSYLDPDEAGPANTSPHKTNSPEGDGPPKRRNPVTTDHLCAMAKYMVEKRDVWVKFTTKCWEEFAKRPENQLRNGNSWYQVARHRAKELNDLYKQYLAEAEGRKPNTTPPQHDDSGVAEAPRSPKAEKVEETSTRSPDADAERRQKRGFDSEPGSRVPSPHKRIKQDESEALFREYIQIEDSSDENSDS